VSGLTQRYDASTRTLAIRFSDGSKVRVESVSEERAQRFVNQLKREPTEERARFGVCAGNAMRIR